MSFLRPHLVDGIDIVVVTYLIYRIFLLVRGTRAAQMLLGLLLLVMGSVIAQWFHLNALSLMISSLEAVWVVGFIIVFQPELRRGLAELGQSRLFRAFVKGSEQEALDEVVAAAEKLSQAKIGALIVLERETGLKAYAESGTPLQAKVSAELLLTIFTPYTPLHDGAVIILRDMIVAAACILPLTQRAVLEKELGTRHRAAIGLTEETDALVVAVSEETRIISLAHDGILERNLDPAALRERLMELTQPGQPYGEE